MASNEKTLIAVALGGNAILQPGQDGTAEQQFANVRTTAEQLAEMVLTGDYKIVVSHGNGPQVGNILLQNEMANDTVPAMPLDICGAQSQGLIGYMMSQELKNLFAQHGKEEIPIATVLTQTVVDEDDPAFDNPTKPVGPFYDKDEAQRLEEEKGYEIIEDAGRGYRRVVPSPDPLKINEREAIRQLVEARSIVIASGGGGIPVVEQNGQLEGREAVIDKDLATERLAEDVGAETLMILTDVDYVYLNYDQDEQRPLKQVDLNTVENYMTEGHFAEGSMKPKAKAALRFLRDGGERAVITSLDNAISALDGQAGTRITK